MKILVIGGGGQLGGKLISLCRGKNYETYSTYLTRRPPLEESRAFPLDKRQTAAIGTLIEQIRPDVVIDTAALTNVDYCESHRDEAWQVNAEGTRKLALACKQVKAKIVFISTDFVFDGRKGNYNEEDLPNPLNYYGVTKLEGERSVAANEDYLVARSSVIYSWKGQREKATSTGVKPENFAMWVVQKLSNGEPVRIVDDQYASPTLADSLAGGLLEALEGDSKGLFHISGKTRLSRFEFALRLADHMAYDKDLITPIKSYALRQAAPRPMDSSLDTTKAEREIGLHTLHIDEALEIFRGQLAS